MTSSRPYRQVTSPRHILFSLLLDPKTPWSHTCVCTQPHQSILLPAHLPSCHLGQPDCALRLSSLSICVWVSLSACVGGGCQGYTPGLFLGCRGWSKRVGWSPGLLTPGTCPGESQVCKEPFPQTGRRTRPGGPGPGGRTQARRERSILPLQADVLNFTFPFIYFFFLNPVSLPEASNLLFNIGLCD